MASIAPHHFTRPDDKLLNRVADLIGLDGLSPINTDKVEFFNTDLNVLIVSNKFGDDIKPYTMYVTDCNFSDVLVSNLETGGVWATIDQFEKYGDDVDLSLFGFEVCE